MNEKISTLLQELAVKFNTTVNHLWSILIRQVCYDGIKDIIILTVSFLLCLIGFVIGSKEHKKYNASGNTDEDPPPLCIISYIVAVIFLIVLIVYLFNLPDTISKFTNPEYWALQKILNY